MRHPEVERAVVYGSRAMDRHKPGSDIDIALEGDSIAHSTLNRIGAELDALDLPYVFDLCVLAKVENKDLKEHVARVGAPLFTRSR
jgi:predicted nucleotidyltransferase